MNGQLRQRQRSGEQERDKEAGENQDMGPGAGKIGPQSVGEDLPEEPAGLTAEHQTARQRRHGHDFQMEEAAQKQQRHQRGPCITQSNRKIALGEAPHSHEAQQDGEEVGGSSDEGKQHG